jgi:tetratricopeptide (TPR) repeat protein
MITIPLQGNLAENAVPKLLLELYRQRYSGALTLESQRIRKKLLLLEGAPVACDSQLASETLCVQLAAEGALPQSDLDRVQQAIARKGYDESSALLDLGILQPRELFAALKQQLRRRTISCFPWTQGSYQLDPDEVPEDPIQPFRADPIELVQEGLESTWEVDRMLAELAPRMDRFPVAARALGGAIAHLRRDQATDAMLMQLDGSCSLATVLADVVRSPTALAAAWVIDASGLVRYCERAVTGAQDESDLEIEIEFAATSDESATAAPEKLDVAAPSADAQPDAASNSQPGSDPGPSAGASAEAMSQSEAMRAEMLDSITKLDDLDFYTILEVGRDARPSDIKKAYFKAAKRYHPDSLARLGLDDMKPEASALFSRMAEAYEVLADDEKRADYDAMLDSDGPELDVELLAQAETFFRKGEILVRMGDFRGALQFLENAVQLWPQESNYQSTLAWALYKKTPTEPERAKEHLEMALELTPEDAVVHFRIGVVLRALGDGAASQEALARAKQLDPSAGESP